jgi:hypothetical protein
MRLQLEGLIEGMIEDGSTRQSRSASFFPRREVGRIAMIRAPGAHSLGPYVRSANSAPQRNRPRYRASGAACPRKAGTKIRSTRREKLR